MQETPEKSQLNVNEVNPNLHKSSSLPLDQMETIIITKVRIDKQLDIILQKQIDVIFITLTYQNKYKYEWEIHKDLKMFKQNIWKMKKDISLLPFKPPSKDFTRILEQISSSQINEMKKYENEILLILNDWTHDTRFKNDNKLTRFWEVSIHSFLESNRGNKPKEGWIQVQSPYNSYQLSCIDLFKCFKSCCYQSWNDCWFLLRDDMICYLSSPVSNEGKGTLWFNSQSEAYIVNNTLVITNNIKTLTLRFEHEFFMKDWWNILKDKIAKFKKKVPNKYGSFVDCKSNCRGKWYVDGHDYFLDLHSALLKAKNSVFITDWWLSPEIFLKRPVIYNKYSTINGPVIAKNDTEANDLSRLCDILNYIALKGVKVYILIYCEIELALTLNSKHSKTFLQNINSNINICRHPKTAFDLLWSHHEKWVVIDQMVAFVGGWDLCWGRYDTHEHKLSDEDNSRGQYYFPGIDYSNARIADFVKVENYLKDSIDRLDQRMPWHDIHSKLEGPAVLDVARHFIERWNYSKSTNKKAITEIHSHDYFKDELVCKDNNIKEAGLNTGNQNDKESKKAKNPLLWSVMAKTDLEHTKTAVASNRKTNIQEMDEIKTINQDEINRIDNTQNPLSDVNGIQDEENNFNTVQHLKPRKNNLFRIAGTMRQVSALVNSTKKYIKKVKQQNQLTFNDQTNLNSWNWNTDSKEPKLTIQCLRSLGEWSSGLNENEHSILNAYCDWIDNSQHYIYIENQFFISKPFTDAEWEAKGKITSNWIVNIIAYHLRKRIERAHENKENFKVFVFIPLLPGFAGEVNTSSTLQVVLKYTYKTISRNHGLSLMELLRNKIGDCVDDYISFYSLRTHGEINSVPKTELIYIHSKWMIVDDKYVIMGSANINDRSMLGERDSEFAVIYKEEIWTPTTFGGKSGECSTFARGLRVSLFAEHLGCDINNKELLNDPLNKDLMKLFKSRAKLNTDTYATIFNCYPNDNFKSFNELPLKVEQTEAYLDQWRQKYQKHKNNIVGHIVEFPLHFLENQILERSFFSAEMLVPIKNFV